MCKATDSPMQQFQGIETNGLGDPVGLVPPLDESDAAKRAGKHIASLPASGRLSSAKRLRTADGLGCSTPQPLLAAMQDLRCSVRPRTDGPSQRTYRARDEVTASQDCPIMTVTRTAPAQTR